MIDMNKKTSGRVREKLDLSRSIAASKASYAVWREDLGLAEVIHRKGKSWHTMGKQERAHYFCTPVEAAFMNDRCNLLVSKNNKILSLKDLFSLLFLKKVTWNSYYAYAYLKRSGYSLWNKPSSFQSVTQALVSAPASNPEAKATETETETPGGVSAAEEEAKPQVQLSSLAALDANGQRPSKIRKVEVGMTGDDYGEVEAPSIPTPSFTPGEGTQRNATVQTSRGWWKPVGSKAPAWFGNLDVPKLPECEVTVFESDIKAFPNLWSFGKKDPFTFGKTPAQVQKLDFFFPASFNFPFVFF